MTGVTPGTRPGSDPSQFVKLGKNVIKQTPRFRMRADGKRKNHQRRRKRERKKKNIKSEEIDTAPIPLVSRLIALLESLIHLRISRSDTHLMLKLAIKIGLLVLDAGGQTIPMRGVSGVRVPLDL